jgi:hypothetical protein
MPLNLYSKFGSVFRFDAHMILLKSGQFMFWFVLQFLWDKNRPFFPVWNCCKLKFVFWVTWQESSHSMVTDGFQVCFALHKYNENRHKVTCKVWKEFVQYCSFDSMTGGQNGQMHVIGTLSEDSEEIHLYQLFTCIEPDACLMVHYFTLEINWKWGEHATFLSTSVAAR